MAYDFIMEMCEIIDKTLCSSCVCFLKHIAYVSVNCLDKVMFMLFMILHKKNKNSSHYDAIQSFLYSLFTWLFLYRNQII